MSFVHIRGPNPWTDERITKLRALTAEGLSCAQIARQLGCGLSRNAVIGKAHRLGLWGPKTGTVKPKAKAPVRRKSQVVMATEALPGRVPVAVISKRIPLEHLGPRQCRWQLWPNAGTGGPDFPSCGNECREGVPYCDGHLLQAYQPASATRARNKQSEKIAEKAEAA